MTKAPPASAQWPEKQSWSRGDAPRSGCSRRFASPRALFKLLARLVFNHTESGSQRGWMPLRMSRCPEHQQQNRSSWDLALLLTRIGFRLSTSEVNTICMATRERGPGPTSQLRPTNPAVWEMRPGPRSRRKLSPRSHDATLPPWTSRKPPQEIQMWDATLRTLRTLVRRPARRAFACLSPGMAPTRLCLASL
jgi:hypothetical protein